MTFLDYWIIPIIGIVGGILPILANAQGKGGLSKIEKWTISVIAISSILSVMNGCIKQSKENDEKIIKEKKDTTRFSENILRLEKIIRTTDSINDVSKKLNIKSDSINRNLSKSIDFQNSLLYKSENLLYHQNKSITELDRVLNPFTPFLLDFTFEFKIDSNFKNNFESLKLEKDNELFYRLFSIFFAAKDTLIKSVNYIKGIEIVVNNAYASAIPEFVLNRYNEYLIDKPVYVVTPNFIPFKELKEIKMPFFQVISNDVKNPNSYMRGRLTCSPLLQPNNYFGIMMYFFKGQSNEDILIIHFITKYFDKIFDDNSVKSWKDLRGKYIDVVFPFPDILDKDNFVKLGPYIGLGFQEGLLNKKYFPVIEKRLANNFKIFRFKTVF